MHRLIINTPDGMHTDHINGDGLDNRRCNLRICTSQQNSMNQKVSKNSFSKFKGVYFRKRTGIWESYITANGKSIFIGCFKKEEDAAKAYDTAAIKYHGEFARLNKAA